VSVLKKNIGTNGLYTLNSRFQNNCAFKYRGKTNKCQIIGLPVTTDDETTVAGAGCVILKFLVQVGILEKVRDGDTDMYKCASDYENKHLMIVGDGLSLERCRKWRLLSYLIHYLHIVLWTIFAT